MSNPRIWNLGTIALTYGSTAAVGDDTGWLLGGVQYGQLNVEGLNAFVASVEDDDHLTLELPWAGETGVFPYSILRENSDATNFVDIYDRITQALLTLSLAGIHPDGVGTIAQRDAYAISQALDAGSKKIWLRAEAGQPFEYYVWNGPSSLSWIGPYPVAQEGPAGADGDVTSSNGSVTNIIKITQAAYDALSPPSATTVYIIVG